MSPPDLPTNIVDQTHSPALFWLGPNREQWTTPFTLSINGIEPEHFLDVMENLLRNPNITSSLLFRADVLYDSNNDCMTSFDSALYYSMSSEHDALSRAFNPNASALSCLTINDDPPMGINLQTHCNGALFRALAKEFQPIPLDFQISNFQWVRAVVRRLVPRNPHIDKSLIQTCHFFRKPALANFTSCNGVDALSEQSKVCPTNSAFHSFPQTYSTTNYEFLSLTSSDEHELSLIIQIPHVSHESQIPFYHPKVSMLAYTYSYSRCSHEGILALHYRPYQAYNENSPTNVVLPTREYRIALNLLKTIHKHMKGRVTGYRKRVQHDRIISQSRVQNTYTDLKMRYAKNLIRIWKEQTDPIKSIFEDLGIAAFLIELWREMYGPGTENFKGFVDIGCGNGMLVHILLNEGYSGWGFDVRKRKSWNHYPKSTQDNLKLLCFIPELILNKLNKTDALSLSSPIALNKTRIMQREGGELNTTILDLLDQSSTMQHNNSSANSVRLHLGEFPPGTFIISNHADELTLWTPILARASNCPFIIIPCCSYNFAGARFRAPIKGGKNLSANTSSSQSTMNSPIRPLNGNVPCATNGVGERIDPTRILPNKSPSTTQKNQVSAYAALCNYVKYLAQRVGYRPEMEILRIPSTRNTALIARNSPVQPDQYMHDTIPGDPFSKNEYSKSAVWHDLGNLIEQEMSMSLSEVAKMWKIALEKSRVN